MKLFHIQDILELLEGSQEIEPKGRRTKAPVIDGLSDDVGIAGLFSSKLNDILNSGCSSAARTDLSPP